MISNLGLIEGLPSWLKVFLLSMIPVLELRASIPWALHHYHDLSHSEIVFWAFLGNLFPNFFILLLLPKITAFARRYCRFLDRELNKLFAKTRKEHSKKFKTFGALAIIIFVGTPIPGSGSWTGSLVAWLFGVKYWKAIALISIGIGIAGAIIFSASLGVMTIWDAF